LTMLYRSTDRRSRRGAPMQNLAHSASFESLDKDAPSKAGTKHLGRFALDGAGSPASRPTDWNLIRSIWIFLASGRFAAKTTAKACWISLDFLGFSRPYRYFSMGYTEFCAKNFLRALCPWSRQPRTGLRFWRGGSINHRGRAYPDF